MGEWKIKLPNNDASHPVLPCPFCGSVSVSATHTEVLFLGENGYGWKKLKMKAYCFCNKCFSRSKPIMYVGYTNANRDFYDDEHIHIYNDGMKYKALDEWNRRG